MYIYIYIYIYVYIWADHGAAHPTKDHCLGTSQRRQVMSEATVNEHLATSFYVVGKLLFAMGWCILRETTAWAPASGARYRVGQKA